MSVSLTLGMSRTEPEQVVNDTFRVHIDPPNPLTVDSRTLNAIERWGR